MKRKWIFVAAPIGIAVFVFLGGWIVQHLWNWLLPDIFGWRQITFWQALGLLVLCRILFGGFHGHGGGRTGMRRRVRERIEQRMRERWDQMTPEERERFRQHIGSAGGPPQVEPRA